MNEKLCSTNGISKTKIPQWIFNLLRRHYVSRGAKKYSSFSFFTFFCSVFLLSNIKHLLQCSLYIVHSYDSFMSRRQTALFSVHMAPCWMRIICELTDTRIKKWDSLKAWCHFIRFVEQLLAFLRRSNFVCELTEEERNGKDYIAGNQTAALHFKRNSWHKFAATLSSLLASVGLWLFLQIHLRILRSTNYVLRLPTEMYIRNWAKQRMLLK